MATKALSQGDTDWRRGRPESKLRTVPEKGGPHSGFGKTTSESIDVTTVQNARLPEIFSACLHKSSLPAPTSQRQQLLRPRRRLLPGPSCVRGSTGCVVPLVGSVLGILESLA